jgi:hypothetical protein
MSYEAFFWQEFEKELDLLLSAQEAEDYVGKRHDREIRKYLATRAKETAPNKFELSNGHSFYFWE